MNTETAAYSGKPLAQQLGIKPGFRVKPRNAPHRYPERLGSVPEAASVSSRLKPVVRKENRR